MVFQGHRCFDGSCLVVIQEESKPPIPLPVESTYPAGPYDWGRGAKPDAVHRLAFLITLRVLPDKKRISVLCKDLAKWLGSVDRSGFTLTEGDVLDFARWEGD